MSMFIILAFITLQNTRKELQLFLIAYKRFLSLKDFSIWSIFPVGNVMYSFLCFTAVS